MVIRAESQRASGNYGIPMTIKSQAETGSGAVTLRDRATGG